MKLNRFIRRLTLDVWGWSAFEKCPKCSQPSGKPCVVTRVIDHSIKRVQPHKCRPIADPEGTMFSATTLLEQGGD